MQKKKGFTLVEMILVIIISWSLLTIIYALLSTLPRVKIYNDARQTLMEQSNNIMNRFAVLFQDYTIDYEEYFNRQMVGCSNTSKIYDKFTRTTNVNGFCNLFTAYGNQNNRKIGQNATSSINYNNIIYQQSNLQPYGQYKSLFRDFGTDTDKKTKIPDAPIVGDADDTDLWTGPVAIKDEKNIKELYLISHDGQKRLLLRKNHRTYADGTTGGTLQMLKLRGFDAGYDHKFDLENSTTYDGQIDTRACDYGAGFSCQGDEISALYPNYKLPNTNDDGRVNLFDENISVENFTIGLSPTKNPDYAWKENDTQINPYIKITLTTKLPEYQRRQKLGNTLSGHSYTLQSSFDTRGFYIQ